MALLLKNACISGSLTDIRIEEGKIAGLGKEQLPSPEDQVLELDGLKVYPGLIDIHSHGNCGHDTMDGIYLNELSEYELAHGITSWCPTTMTMPIEDVRRVTDVDLSAVRGAQVLGFHMEGPYIAMKYKGAQNEEYIRKPDAHEFASLKNMALVTIAPEVPGALEFIASTDKVVCLGHTDTDYEQAMAAFSAGARCVTHMMNAMPPLHHRKPALFGAAVMADAYVQVISDGVHIHPAVVMTLYKLFGPARMVLISDSVMACGMPDGSYTLGGQPITVVNGQARTLEGNLAGSTTNLFDMVRHAIEFGIPEEDAFRMASRTPAELLGISDHKGVIAEGADADLLILNPDGTLKQVISRGVFC